MGQSGPDADMSRTPADSHPSLPPRPRVFLVGAGPGDPDLISVRGLRLLEQADVVLYDRLVDPSLVARAPAGAELIYVGKRSAQHTVPQDGINELILEHARTGKLVVRLKGGDPFIFGRGGEEAAYVRAAGVACEIVPGISAGYGAPAYAGIPVTHRGIASHVTFVTGHEDPTKEEAHIDWDKLASDVGTLVIFMGVKNLPQVVEQLVSRGRSADTPVALIRYGTLPKQRTVVGTLADIVEKVAAAKLRPPAITIVGEVVNLREHLRWFEDRPLFGKRVVVTRPRAQAVAQMQALRDLGAEVVAFPTIRIEPVSASPEIDAMLRALHEYDLIVFTSVNGVECFFDRLAESGGDVRRLHRATVAAIGPKTADACRVRGLNPDVLPATYVAEGVLAALDGEPGALEGNEDAAGGATPPVPLAGARVLIPGPARPGRYCPRPFGPGARRSTSCRSMTPCSRTTTRTWSRRSSTPTTSPSRPARRRTTSPGCYAGMVTAMRSRTSRRCPSARSRVRPSGQKACACYSRPRSTPSRAWSTRFPPTISPRARGDRTTERAFDPVRGLRRRVATLGGVPPDWYTPCARPA